MLVSEDDFLPVGALEYKDPSVSGVETDLKKTDEMLSLVRKEVEKASAKEGW